MSVLAFKIGCPSACMVAFRRRVASGPFGFAELGTGKAGGVESYGFFGCKLQATARSRYITASVIQADAFTWTSAISACEKARLVQSAGTAK